jgi:GTP-dependent phosphoenolpyruvate carboxykinase
MFARVASLRANLPVGLPSRPTVACGRRSYNAHTTSYTPNTKLNAWITEMEKLCQPTRVHVCSGSDQENAQLIDGLVRLITAAIARHLRYHHT